MSQFSIQIILDEIYHEYICMLCLEMLVLHKTFWTIKSKHIFDCHFNTSVLKKYFILITFVLRFYKLYSVRQLWLYSAVTVSHFDYQFKGVLHLWALFLKTFCIFSTNKATLDKKTYGSGQKCSKELKNHSFTSVEAIVFKVTVKNMRKSIFLNVLNHKSITTWVSEIPVQLLGSLECYL